MNQPTCYYAITIRVPFPRFMWKKKIIRKLYYCQYESFVSVSYQYGFFIIYYAELSDAKKARNMFSLNRYLVCKDINRYERVEGQENTVTPCADFIVYE